MKIDIISAVPELLDSPLNYSIVQRAKEKNLVDINVINLHDYGLNKYKQIDDTQYGGGAGMVLMVEPLYNCIMDLKRETVYDEIIYLTPDGDTYNQKTANSLSLKGNLLLICGHYKGVDERIREHLVTLEISVGDYVLSGGEIAAAILTDSIVRLIPGVINDIESALSDSFQDDLLSPPVYTRPADFKGWKVPDILLSGHDQKIGDWRLEQSIRRTEERRPDLLKE